MAEHKLNGIKDAATAKAARPSRRAKKPATKAPKVFERHDVIAMARKFAADLEAGDYGEPLNIMLVLECKSKRKAPTVELFGWGPNADGLHGLGMLASGLHILQS